MDVRCERCSTEYEFDDALVSGRGTTVKCTNCGHKFKIRRSDGDFSEDFWNVATAEGKTLVFTSLRELQRAIQNRLVDRADKLSRGGLPPKAIGGIPELVAFFDQRDQKEASPPRRTLPPIAPPPGPEPPPRRYPTKPDFPPMSIAEAMPTPIVRPATQTLIGGSGSIEEAAALAAPSMRGADGIGAGAGRERARARRRGGGERARAHERSAAHPAARRAAHPSEREAGQDSDAGATPRLRRPCRTPPIPNVPLRRSSTRTGPERSVPIELSPLAPPVIERSVPIEFSSPLPPPVQARPAIEELSDPTPMRRESPSLVDGPPSMNRRRGVGGFLVAIVVLGSIALVGALWARGHLGQFLGGKGGGTTTNADPRVTELLGTGEKALQDGNLDLARESFDKASALAEKDPHVLVDLARQKAARADQQWLKSRLLPTDALDEQRLAQSTLGELAPIARKAAEDAAAASPDDATAIRTRIDALRISGERDGARALVSKIASTGAQPETSYVLAALDLAESEPLWSTVIERLRTAANVETGPGRARLALTYALARSGDAASAKAEIARLDQMARKPELLPALRAFVDRSAKLAPNRPALDGGVFDAGPLERDPKKPLSNDPRVLVGQAEAARAKGDFTRARAALQCRPRAQLHRFGSARRDRANSSFTPRSPGRPRRLQACTLE